MQIQKKLLTPNIYSRPTTKMRGVEKIAIHYVGNAGSSAIANRNYFENLKNTHKTYASSHYIVGLKGEIIQCVEEGEVAYCTNSANSYAISIECCHAKADGKFNEATYNSLVELCADICRRYSLEPISDIIRHYDVTGKKCPLYWVNNYNDYMAFKNKVKYKLEELNEMVTQGNVVVNGKSYKCDRILKDESNYIKVNNFANMGFNVGYNADTKAVTINNRIDEIVINNKKVEAVNIDGYNYVKLRDIAELLGKDVEIANGDIVVK